MHWVYIRIIGIIFSLVGAIRIKSLKAKIGWKDHWRRVGRILWFNWTWLFEWGWCFIFVHFGFDLLPNFYCGNSIPYLCLHIPLPYTLLFPLPSQPLTTPHPTPLVILPKPTTSGCTPWFKIIDWHYWRKFFIRENHFFLTIINWFLPCMKRDKSFL